MERRTTALLIAGFAVAMVAVGLVTSVVDDGGTAGAEAPGTACITDPPLVVVDVDDGNGGSALTVVQPDGAQSVVPSPADVVLDADVLPDRSGLVAVVAIGDYESAGPESTAIWTMALDGSGARAVTEAVDVPAPTPPDDGVPRPPATGGTSSLDDQPVVSPDGGTVAFTRHGGDGTTSILTVPLAGGEPTAVVADVPHPGVSSPEWSPTGERLAYVRSMRDDTGADLSSEVHTIAPDGSDDRLVATLTGATTLDWSPDGAQLLVSGGPPGPGARTVTAVDVAGGTTRTIAEGARRARWSRGGTQVVMVVEGDDGYRVVERTVAGVDGADVSGGSDRDLGVALPRLYPDQDIAVAACIP